MESEYCKHWTLIVYMNIKCFVYLLVLCLIVSCTSAPQTLLTSAQQFAIADYGREKYTRELDLTENERIFVDNTFPNFNYYIMSYPYSQYNLSWETPGGRKIKIYGTGDITILENAKIVVE